MSNNHDDKMFADIINTKGEKIVENIPVGTRSKANLSALRERVQSQNEPQAIVWHIENDETFYGSGYDSPFGASSEPYWYTSPKHAPENSIFPLNHNNEKSLAVFINNIDLSTTHKLYANSIIEGALSQAVYMIKQFGLDDISFPLFDNKGVSVGYCQYDHFDTSVDLKNAGNGKEFFALIIDHKDSNNLADDVTKTLGYISQQINKCEIRFDHNTDRKNNNFFQVKYKSQLLPIRSSTNMTSLRNIINDSSELEKIKVANSILRRLDGETKKYAMGVQIEPHKFYERNIDLCRQAFNEVHVTPFTGKELERYSSIIMKSVEMVINNNFQSFVTPNMTPSKIEHETSLNP
jgi:hypothetical protein